MQLANAEGIEFHYESVSFQLVEPEEIKIWLNQIAAKYKHSIYHLNYIFCTDKYLLNLNIEHLGHDTFTDILTFPFHNDNSTDIVADIYISIDRVTENASELKISMIDELHRVIAHGLLHLVGFDDTTFETKENMRKAEDLALSLRMF